MHRLQSKCCVLLWYWTLHHKFRNVWLWALYRKCCQRRCVDQKIMETCLQCSLLRINFLMKKFCLIQNDWLIHIVWLINSYSNFSKKYILSYQYCSQDFRHLWDVHTFSIIYSRLVLTSKTKSKAIAPLVLKRNSFFTLWLTKTIMAMSKTKSKAVSPQVLKQKSLFTLWLTKTVMTMSKTKARLSILKLSQMTITFYPVAN